MDCTRVRVYTSRGGHKVAGEQCWQLGWVGDPKNQIESVTLDVEGDVCRCAGTH